MAIRVLLVDDHPVVLRGLRALLGREPGLEIVGEALDGESAVRAARELAPDIVVTDISMPGLDGIEVTRQILQNAPRTRVVVLSMEADRLTMAEAFQAGASAYVSKCGPPEEIVSAVRAVAAGQTYVTPPSSLVSQRNEILTKQAVREGLTPLER